MLMLFLFRFFYVLWSSSCYPAFCFGNDKSSFAKNRYVEGGSGLQKFQFTIPKPGCGTTITEAVPQDKGNGAGTKTVYSNTIVIQSDAKVQDIWDAARKISCDWPNMFQKMVSFQPFEVETLETVEVEFTADEKVDCWMDLQLGKYPESTTINSVVRIGENLSLVVFERDDEGSYDLLVRDCYAYSGPDFESPTTIKIQLTDEQGCVLREKLMSPFYKMRKSGPQGPIMVAYSHLQAFKFPDFMEVFTTCNIEICKQKCDDQCLSIAEQKISVTEVQPEDSGTESYFPGYLYDPPKIPFTFASRKTTPVPRSSPVPAASVNIPSKTDLPPVQPSSSKNRKPILQCPQGTTDPRCPNLTTKGTHCRPGTNDPRCLSVSASDISTMCAPGSTDIRCISFTTSAPTRPRPCLPGSTDPTCTSPTQNAPLSRCYTGTCSRRKSPNGSTKKPPNTTTTTTATTTTVLPFEIISTTRTPRVPFCSPGSRSPLCDQSTTPRIFPFSPSRPIPKQASSTLPRRTVIIPTLPPITTTKRSPSIVTPSTTRPRSVGGPPFSQKNTKSDSLLRSNPIQSFQYQRGDGRRNRFPVYGRRIKRQANATGNDKGHVRLIRSVQVISPTDLVDLTVDLEKLTYPHRKEDLNSVCMSVTSFYLGLCALLGLVVFSIMIATVECIRNREHRKMMPLF